MTANRTSLRGLCLLALAALTLAPTPANAGSTPEEPPTPTVLEATEDEAGKILAALEKSKADKDPALMAAALLEMEGLSDKRFVPWIREGLKSKDNRVIQWSIRAAASHELADVEKAVVKLLGASKKKGKKKDAAPPGTVGAAAIDYLARMAVEGHEKVVLQDHLKSLFLREGSMKSSWAEDKLRACVHYLGQMKYDAAVPVLVDLIEEPYPKDVNSGTNPPASYWEARYKLWQKSEGWVRWALKEITEKEYRTHREWQAWVKLNKKRFK